MSLKLPEGKAWMFRSFNRASMTDNFMNDHIARTFSAILVTE